ncbi:MAG TPA: branched-chain amino acid ABC transporter permease [Fimbriimonadaceae bacterium]|nr:branched-chain amino acid ABC transporter permease [Fimbriimonadaceae bacterium]
MSLGRLFGLAVVVFLLVGWIGRRGLTPSSFPNLDSYKQLRQSRAGATDISAAATGTVDGQPVQWFVLDKTAPSDKTKTVAIDLIQTKPNGSIVVFGGTAPAGYSGPTADQVVKGFAQNVTTVESLPPPGSEFPRLLLLDFLTVLGTTLAISGFFGVLLARALSLVAGVSLCFLVDLLAHQQGDYAQRLIVLAGLYVTLSVSLNLINGITGQFSIGHAAFYQIGAYLAGFVTVTYFRGIGIPPLVWLALMAVVGAIGAGLAGFIVGLPSLRLKGDYLAIVTLGFGEIIRIEVQNTQALGGSYGMNVAPKIQPIWMVWMLAIVCIAVCRNLVKTAHGLPFLAVREDEVASAAMGVNVTRVKVAAFIIGSMFAGAAGALLAHYEGFITINFFTMDISFIILTMVVLGGTGSITGSAVAAAFLFYLPEQLRNMKNPDGTNLTVTAASVVAALLAVAIATGFVRRIMDRSNAPRWTKLGQYLGAVTIALVAKFVVQFILEKIPALHNMTIEAGQLRMPIFAITLIVLMLLRPQGIFGHHEFSWTWLQKLFLGKKTPKGKDPTPAVAA